MTAESRRPLGYGLLGGAAGLTLLLLLWLATSGAQAGGVVLGLVLIFVLAGPLAGAGWYVLARASADAVEERAFVGKQRVLEADHVFRTQLAVELRELAAKPGLPADRLRRIVAQLDPAEHDEIARYDAIQLSDAQVALLKQYDDLVWQRVRWLRDHGGANEASAGEAVDQLQQAIDQRSDLLLRGRQAAPVEPSVLLQASPPAGSAAVEALDVGDAITYEGSDYVVECVATSFSNGQTWKLAHLVPSGAGSHDCWLSVAPGGLDVAWLESLTPPPQPSVSHIVVQATSLPLAGSRSAVTRVSSTAGTASGVLVRSWHYRAGSLVGIVEEWADGSVHGYGGRSITPDAVQVWPASHTVEGVIP
jgi:Domain of unknown function (DUF4178)